MADRNIQQQLTTFALTGLASSLTFLYLPTTVGAQSDTETTEETEASESLPPESLPVANVSLTNGLVTIELRNQIAGKVYYEVLGETGQRTLDGSSQVTLPALQAPVSINFYRPNGRFILVEPEVPATPGVAIIHFRPTDQQESDRRVLTIQENGAIVFN
ncbi:hypothetical protein [Geitlerinema sp. PCC 9228]|jgi:hypothetical protein|uniref:hypothetical protein n=1 Tax=Geitlerinema sp. PCC 9228 TaxID=111611 RepID=UPI0008F9BB09|nr:hypothetical protein [Geitlerinema sp. PCC 9228]